MVFREGVDGWKKAIGSVRLSVFWPRLELLWRLFVILGLVDNKEERLGLAKKVGVASVVAQKDRLACMS